MDDSYAITLAKTELREAYRTGDVRRALRVFSDGLIDLSFGRPNFYGPEAKVAHGHALEQLFRRHRARLAVVMTSIQVLGDTAYTWGWHILTLTPRGGGRVRRQRTRYVEIWHKESDGRWRIGLFIDSPDLPPQMVPADKPVNRSGSKRAPRARRARRRAVRR